MITKKNLADILGIEEQEVTLVVVNEEINKARALMEATEEDDDEIKREDVFEKIRAIILKSDRGDEDERELFERLLFRHYEDGECESFYGYTFIESSLCNEFSSLEEVRREIHDCENEIERFEARIEEYGENADDGEGGSARDGIEYYDELKREFIRIEDMIETRDSIKPGQLLESYLDDLINLGCEMYNFPREAKLKVLKERFAEVDEVESLKTFITLSEDSDPNFFFWLFDRNEALVNIEDGHPTELGQEIFDEFLERI